MTRSSNGIDGQWKKHTIFKNGAIMLRKPLFVNDNKRALVGFHTVHRNGSGCFYSDDDGLSWKLSNQVQVADHEPGGLHKGYRWNHGAVEPSLVELKDGRIWMLMRTAQDHHYESFSSDHGTTWSEPKPSRFYGTITMPNIGRLMDGRLLLIWNNATPLPELPGTNGIWEDVFTNRDVLHCAISEDDGKSWIGFRELYLNPSRYDSIFATRLPEDTNDRSVHQSEFIEVDTGKVLVSLGQHHLHRRLLLFDVEWLYEKERYTDFSDDLEQWSTQKYIKGIKGHCAYNRKHGATLVPHPEKKEQQAMHLRSLSDSSLLYQNDGALWNFPAGTRGELTIKLKINQGSKGTRISLLDRWFNPIDTTSSKFAMFNFEIPVIGENTDLALWNQKDWNELKFKWSNTQETNGKCQVFLNDTLINENLPINFTSMNGISYVHLISTSQEEDPAGILIESVYAKTKR
ncbi:sialidase family protein [Fulvivirgaceae bacterium BMA10]|uniref:Sialidase family protein n=1 Tax=Splendidivirga corallicola TaxID=3051826 RepID=A0ABT8KIT9_9BACT|nr:sialidase family protein [Fulvivirgaceae bacterium BMA10]